MGNLLQDSDQFRPDISLTPLKYIYTMKNLLLAVVIMVAVMANTSEAGFRCYWGLCGTYCVNTFQGQGKCVNGECICVFGERSDGRALRGDESERSHSGRT